MKEDVKNLEKRKDLENYFQYKGTRIRRSLKTRSKKVAEIVLMDIDVQIAKDERKLSSP